jgi:hypothetical protein
MIESCVIVNVVFPAAHCTHAEAPIRNAALRAYVPPLQVLQMDAPLLEVYWPASHAKQADALELDVKNPTSHCVHTDALVTA